MNKKIMEKISSDMEEIEMSGGGVIEVMLSQKSGNVKTFFGFDGYKVVKAGGFGYDARMRVVIRKDVGIAFYPDEKGRCWGWIIDTEKNRKLLAGSIKHGTFIIVNNKIKEAIEDLAVSLGYPIKKMGLIDQEREIDKMLTKGKAAPAELKSENDDLRAQLADLQKRLALNGEMSDYVKEKRPVSKGLTAAIRQKAKLEEYKEAKRTKTKLKNERANITSEINEATEE
jgi:hypothetical protein